MKFAEVVGQDEIRGRLIQLVHSNRVSHALLFSGQPGSGHYALALAFAQYLQCQNRGETDSCGVCPSCHQAQQHIHPDIHYVFPVARTAEFKAGEEPYSDRFLEVWRSYLATHKYPSLQEWYRTIGIENQQAGIFKREAQEILKKLSFKAYESEYKVLIIWMPEKMHPVAANKLLKIIEEPPEKTIFLMVSDHPKEILPTISSRTQMIKVPVIQDKTLQVRIGEEEQVADFRQKFISWMRLVYKLEIGPLQQLIQKLAEMGRERQKAFLVYGIGIIRSNYMLSCGVPQITSLDTEEQAFATRFHRFIHPANYELIIRDLEEAVYHIGMNANPKILFTDLSFRLRTFLKMAIPAGD